MPRDPELRTLFELAGAVLRGYHNEIALDEKRGLNDPVKLRFGTWDDPGNEYVATISFDLLEGDEDDPVRREKGYIGLLFDPDPCIDFWLQQTIDGTEDRTMVKVARFAAAGLELLAPVRGIPGGGGSGHTFTSPNGRFRTQFQDDGHQVVYDTWDARWLTNPPAAAVWSNWHGLLRPLPW